MGGSKGGGPKGGGPKGGGPKGVGPKPRKGGGPKGGEPKISRFFFLFSASIFILFVSLGIFSWNFGGVLVGRDLKCACFRPQAVLWKTPGGLQAARVSLSLGTLLWPARDFSLWNGLKSKLIGFTNQLLPMTLLELPLRLDQRCLCCEVHATTSREPNR